MLKAIQYQLLKINKAAGLEVCLLDGGSMAINVVTAEVYKNKIRHEALATTKDLGQLSGTLKPAIPVWIAVTGKGILSKISGKEKITPEQVLPNTNHKDYYFEFINESELNIACVAKKETIDGLIKTLSDAGYQVLGFSLGVSSLHKIIKFISIEEGYVIHTTNSAVKLNSNKCIAAIESNITAKESPYPEYLVGDQYLKANQLAAYGAAISLLSDNVMSDAPLSSQTVTTNRTAYKGEKLFKAAVWSSLGLILAILLVNFLVYNYYFSINQRTEAQSSLDATESVRLDSLQKSVRENRTFLENTGWNKQSVASFMADRIGGMVPGSILLTSMNIYPSNTEGSAFKHDTILVSGTCDDAVEVNKFMNNIKSIDHVVKASVTGYQYRRESETGVFQMEIITQ